MIRVVPTRYEIVVADGEVLECTKEKNSDLYWAIPWSYGTFGFLTAIDVMIIPYKVCSYLPGGWTILIFSPVSNRLYSVKQCSVISAIRATTVPAHLLIGRDVGCVQSRDAARLQDHVRHRRRGQRLSGRDHVFSRSRGRHDRDVRRRVRTRRTNQSVGSMVQTLVL